MMNTRLVIQRPLGLRHWPASPKSRRRTIPWCSKFFKMVISFCTLIMLSGSLRRNSSLSSLIATNYCGMLITLPRYTFEVLPSPRDLMISNWPLKTGYCCWYIDETVEWCLLLNFIINQFLTVILYLKKLKLVYFILFCVLFLVYVYFDSSLFCLTTHQTLLRFVTFGSNHSSLTPY